MTQPTDLERVKRRLGLPNPTVASAEMDEQITTLINAVTASFESFLGLPLTTSDRVEVHSIRDSLTRSIWLRNYYGAMTAPVIASVKTRSSLSTAWADVDALDTADYALSEGTPGLLAFRMYLPEGDDTVRVALTDVGFADDTATFITNYPAIADAADAQVVYEFERRMTPGQHTLTAEGTVSTQPEVRLLASVTDRLSPYRRVSL